MRRSAVAVGAGLTLLLGACGKDPSAADFKAQTEKFLQSDKTVKPKLGQQFTKASCETPASTTKGTQFSCTAVGADDSQTYTFAVEITSKSNYTVTLSGTNDPDTGTATTAPPAGSDRGGTPAPPGSGTTDTTAPGSGGSGNGETVVSVLPAGAGAGIATTVVPAAGAATTVVAAATTTTNPSNSLPVSH